MDYEHIAARFANRKLTAGGSGFTARCPAHDDNRNSLSISRGQDGRTVVHCHVGCTPEAVVKAAGLTLADLFEATRGGNGHDHDPKPKPQPTPAAPPAYKIFATDVAAVEYLERRHGAWSTLWVYHNAQAEPVGVVVRWDTPTGKRILPVSRVEGGWANTGMPAPRPLYRLPDLLAKPSERVYVVEGEKAAEAGRDLGLLTTTSAHGAQAADKTDWTPLAGRDCVLLPDNDPAGQIYANQVAAILGRLTPPARVRIARMADAWPKLPPKGDLADVAAMDDAATVTAVLADLTAAVHEADPDEHLPRRAEVLSYATIKRKPITWLWPQRIALGKLTLIAGDPDVGKSMLTCDLAARVSTGVGWPDRPHEMCAPGSVVMMNAEDGSEDTIGPRLDAANANCRKVYDLRSVIVKDRESGKEVNIELCLATDIDIIERTLQRVEDCRLVIIDPITAYLGGTDSHKNAEVRGVLAPLSKLADRYNVSIVAVTHLNKSAGGPAIYRTMGSLAFAAAARAVWGVTKDKDDATRRLMIPVKNNIARSKEGLAYTIVSSVDGRDDSPPVIAWEADAIDMTADAAMGDPDQQRGASELDEAVEWLRAALADGPRQANELYDEATNGAGISKRTLERAKKVISVAYRDKIPGPWLWKLKV